MSETLLEKSDLIECLLICRLERPIEVYNFGSGGLTVAAFEFLDLLRLG
ncbi:MAG: hypothetical protein NZ899_00625 [Thermoguttaceae bacterium]|nr:hypothetical protein [Thermoguttaceae bacterium]MDW8077399.1 hypothetical protein [Thermoguttaceae bacterium]